jgi:hypothetical protein
MVISFPPISALIARLESGLETPEDAVIAVLAERARAGNCRARAFFACIDGHALLGRLHMAGMRYGGRAPPWFGRCLARIGQLRDVRAGDSGSGNRTRRSHRRPKMQGVAS